ncbi:TPA: conjugal transfer protein TraD [Legionella pneumophila]|nr:conjugal transfer protein TraD [Legionella pneumophila]HAT1760447.1 conjugal transfer protein TraD [Legionella pneumophila]HAT1763315.1 conjugal transfer protein TraD [Legionella pneumophila]HAT1766385.1 conjugal transfer protein TraD [Legionella pneumophila]HAT1812225.1 conjugal transfer protein TraD [Legionella pneumophila]
MVLLNEIEKEKQMLARCQKALSLEKIKKRRSDTRYKIELGGLVIKSMLHTYNKSIILGALKHVHQLLEKDERYLRMFESSGNYHLRK